MIIKPLLVLLFVFSFNALAIGQESLIDSTKFKKIASVPNIVLENKNFNQGIINTPYQLFNGRLAGLGMSTFGADPNGEFVLRVRGLSTLQNESKPLIVVDGFVVNDFLLVDASDIEQISLLKDAASTSLYGLQGGNGVLLITTKVRKTEALSVSFNSSVGVEQPIFNVIPLTASEYKAVKGSTDLGSSTNWLNEITRTGVSVVNNLSFNGGSKNFSIRAAINQRKATGVLNGSGFDQLNARISVEQKALNDKTCSKA
jgi:iron complex outermembrane receptor protein